MRLMSASLVTVLSVAHLAFAAPPPCKAPEDVAGIVAPLPDLRTSFRRGATLNVLAVGSATVFGPEASLARGTVTNQALSHPASDQPVAALPQGSAGTPSQYAFPLQMARALEAAVPGLTVSVTVRGGRGMSASDMVPLIHSEFAAHHYQLLLWQTGTVEAVRNISPGDFASTLMDGVDTARSAGADVVLVDSQFSRFLEANTDIDRYKEALQQVAITPGVALFHRFDLMRAWASDGQLDLERTSPAEREHAIERLHACLGESLARMVLAGANS